MSNVYIIIESADRLALVDLDSKMVERITSNDLDATRLASAGIGDVRTGADAMIDLAIALATVSKGAEVVALKNAIQAVVAAQNGGSVHVPALKILNDDFNLTLDKTREAPSRPG